MSVSPPQKKSTEHTEDTEKDFRRMIKTTPSALSPQTSDLRIQTSFLRYTYSITVFEKQKQVRLDLMNQCSLKGKPKK